jgi:membrane protease YdiL (CAAX protease family)
VLDPDWFLTRPILAVVLVGMLALLIARTIRSDRRTFPRFKRYRTTKKRQEFYRRMLRDSVLQIGLGAVAVLVLVWSFVPALLSELTQWPMVREVRGFAAAQPVATAAIVGGLLLVIVVLTWIGVRGARSEGITAIGDVSALLPRNRQELRWGWLLSINAGVSEELMMRLALPTLIYAVTGSAAIAVAGSVVVFGALHAYQGVAGVIGTSIVGAVMTFLYAVSGTIVVPIVVHFLLDWRSMVFLPRAVYDVHLVDGRVTPISRPPVPPDADAAPPASHP